MHPDLKIKIPRGAYARTSEYWKLVREHGGSRASMVDFICGIGGYSDRSERFAISFNIKDYHSDLSVENLWKLLCSNKIDAGPEPTLPPEHMARAKALFWRVYEENKDHLYGWARDEAYEGWEDSDTPYETFVGDRRIDWEWEIHGRCGGHLCMTHCAGINLQCSPEELREKLSEKESPTEFTFSHAQVRDLFIICVQNTVDLQSRKISDEIEYRAAWRLWVSFCEDELPVLIEQYEERGRLSEDAGKIIDVLDEKIDNNDSVLLRTAFKKICQLADVKIAGE